MAIPDLTAIRDWCVGKFQPKGDYATEDDVVNLNNTINTKIPKGQFIFANIDSGVWDSYSTSLGITKDDTIEEVFQKYPLRSLVIIATNNQQNAFSSSLPIDLASIITMYKWSEPRGIINLQCMKEDKRYSARVMDGAITEWVEF